MRRSLIGSIALAVSCSGRIEYLAPPPVGAARTLIVAVDTHEGAPQLSIRRAESFELVLEEPASDRVDVAVIGLEATLEELELEEGLVPTEPDGVPLLDLPRTAILQATFRDGWTAWSEVEPPAALAAVRLPRVGCSETIDRSIETFSDQTLVAFAAPLDDGNVLLVMRSRAVVWSPSDGVLRSAYLPFDVINGALDAAHGVGYFSRGELSAIDTLDLGTLQIVSTASTAQSDAGVLRWIAADGDLLFVLSSTGRFFRREAGSFAELGSIPVARDRTRVGGVLLLAPDEVLFGADLSPDLHRWDGQSIATELTGPLDSEGFAALAVVPTLGPVTVERESGQIFARPEAEWMQIGRMMGDVRIVIPIGPRRFIAADGVGRWSEFHPIHGAACGIWLSNVLSDLQAVFQVGTSVYAAGPGRSGTVEIAHIAEIR